MRRALPSMRSLFACVVIAATLAAAGCRNGSRREMGDLFSEFGCEGCNVVLLTLDTVRADHLPCYGHPRDTAPELCRFGDDNLLFENAFSPAPATIPAFRTIFGGSLVANEEAPDVLAFYENRASLAELMAERGYLTAAFTDHNGLGSLDRRRRKNSDLQRGFEIFRNYGEGRDGVATSRGLTDAILAWLDEPREGPFFLWVHYFDPHFNFAPLPEDEGALGFSAEDCGRIRNGMDIREIKDIESDLDARELDCLVALHQAEILATDRDAGRVLERIESLGLGPDTLIIVTADHGEEFLERARIGHERTVYNELVRVPLMIRNPRAPERRRIEAPISTAEIFDIVLGATAGEPISLERPVISRAHHYYGGRNDPRKVRSHPNEYALFAGNHKVIFTPRTETWEYYDLREDPGETTNLWGGRAGRRQATTLLAWLEENTVESATPSDETRDNFEKTNERLKGLGYVH